MESGAEVTAENGNVYTLTLEDGEWTATYNAPEVEVTLGEHGGSVMIETAEDGTYRVGEDELVSGGTVTAENANMYTLTLVDGEWMAAFNAPIVNVTLGVSGTTITIDTAEDGTYRVGEDELVSGDTVEAENGNTYRLTLVAGEWSPVFQPKSMEIIGTDLMAMSREDDTGYGVGDHELDENGSGDIVIDGDRFCVSMDDDGNLMAEQFDAKAEATVLDRSGNKFEGTLADGKDTAYNEAGARPAVDGDEKVEPSERLVALGFLRMGPWEADANSQRQLRLNVLNELTATTGEVFLGLTVGCAQCHDHKYDPIPQRDFYRLQAFFAPMRVEDRPAAFTDAEYDRKMKRQRREHEDQLDRATEEFDKRRQALIERFMESKNVTEDDDKVKEFKRELGVQNEFFRDRKDPIFREEVWLAYLAAKDEKERLQELFQRYQPVAVAVSDLVPPDVPDLPDTHVLAGGELDSELEKVEPGFLECITGAAGDAKIPFVDGSSGRRRALAEWIASPDNPLTARVMVNRLWQHHFGQGLLRTPSDVGKNGDRPSHPELLDWLAEEFGNRGWSIKAMHRLMLTSKTYQQSTGHPDWKRHGEVDSDNRLLSRMNWTRLEAEVLRDSVLFLSGRLNPEPGGPGSLFDVPADVAEGFEFFKWFASPPEQQRRRSVYTFQRRSVLQPFLETFDVANMSESCSRRNTTTVAPQALTLLNGELVNTEARHFAERIARAAGPDPQKQIEQAFWLALSRPPSQGEVTEARELLAQSAPLEGFTRLGVVLFNLNEFLYLE